MHWWIQHNHKTMGIAWDVQHRQHAVENLSGKKERTRGRDNEINFMNEFRARTQQICELTCTVLEKFQAVARER